MRINKAHIIGIAALSCLIVGFKQLAAQDPQFSQFYAASLNLNPALTGNTEQIRVTGNYRKQWPRVPGAFTSTSFSYDQYFRKIKSGAGLLVLTDQAGSGSLKFTSIGGLYSYHLTITRTMSLRMGVRASYVARSVDLSAFTFSDQFIREDLSSTVEFIERSKHSYLDLAAGSIIYSKKYWLGFSLGHLNTPNQSFVGIKSSLPIKFAAHSGYKMSIETSVKGIIEKSVTIMVNYKAQQDWNQFDVGIYYNQDPFVVGIWYRGIPLLKAYKPGYFNNDALILMVGYIVKDYMTIGYSYDLTISKLGAGTLGSHEISLIYEFAQQEYRRDGKKKNFMVPCTKF